MNGGREAFRSESRGLKTAMETIVLGGGCFWCTEAAFLRLKGVEKVTSGYAGGHVKNPTYEQVCSGTTGHAEVIRVEYSGTKTLDKILDLFFAVHDPTQLNRQGHDVGEQYRSIVLYSTETQKKAVQAFIGKIKGTFAQPIVTEVKRLEAFYPAEEEHARYFDRNPNQPYCQLVIVPKLENVKEKLDK